MATAAELKVSDVFWKPGGPPWMRIKGAIEPTEFPVLTEEDTTRLAHSLMRERDWERFQDYPERDIGLTIPDLCRLRINVYRERGNICLVMRLIPLEIPTLDELEMPEVLKTVAMSPQGLVLVTGPTGCGKSTTLAGMLDHINRNRKAHIVSIEDPIEYVHQDKHCIVSQREVSIDTESFADALKYCLRQNPDIILIGEMRDVETFNTAMQSAETGHLVFSTVHTTSASETMERILNMFPPSEREQVAVRLSRTLRAVISQALIPRMDAAGRVAALEIMVVTPTVRKYIEDGRASQVEEAIEDGGHWGMQTKNQALLKLYADKVISAEEAMFNAGNYTQMRQILQRYDKEQADVAAAAKAREEEIARKRRAQHRAREASAAAAQQQAQPPSDQPAQPASSGQPGSQRPPGSSAPPSP
ncbi:MAG: PilT/PilU family type 4a pilus ATPase [candidate division WS1 bacterium]|nr:PilT/PilU family type 4a pilus ATPase [candidate division WS1 bacterium]